MSTREFVKTEKMKLRKAQSRHADYYAKVLDELDNTYLGGEENVSVALHNFEQEWMQMIKGQAWAHSHAMNFLEVAEICMKYPNRGANLLHLRQNIDQNIEWLEASLLAANQLQRKGQTVIILGNLGVAYHERGEVHKAIEYFEQKRGLAREFDDVMGDLIAPGNLGIAYDSLGRAEKALQTQRRNLVW